MRSRESAVKWHSARAKAGADKFNDIYSKLLGISKYRMRGI